MTEKKFYKNIRVQNFEIGKEEKLTFISGPCVIESEEHTLFCAEKLKEMFSETNFNFIFKASYDKANRSSIHSFRGPGIEKGLKILEKVKTKLNLPILTDVHSPEDAKRAGEVCDMIQIPAFLSRQTDLLVAAANTKASVNVKKGQFLAPWDMKNVIEKLEESGAKDILLTERGASFGYNNLVSDMRAIPIMQSLGYPVCFDASHSTQMPGGLGSSSGGQSEFIPHLAKAAVAVGADALFIESHPDPKSAKSDAATVMDLKDLKKLLVEIERLKKALTE